MKARLLAIRNDRSIPPCKKQAAIDQLKRDLKRELATGTYNHENAAGNTVKGLNKNGIVQA